MENEIRTDRRSFLAGASAAVAAAATPRAVADEAASSAPQKAQIAITLDLEMSRNFPGWDDRQWDYEKGNLNQAAKDYTVKACRRVRERGGVIHCFVVGQVLRIIGS